MSLSFTASWRSALAVAARVDVKQVSTLVVSAGLCIAPLIVTQIMGNYHDNQKTFEHGLYVYRWQRANTIHCILSSFYLIDLTFDVVVTGLKSEFVIFNAYFFLEQFISGIICRKYFSDGRVAAFMTTIDIVFAIWFLLALLHKCCPAVWTKQLRSAAFVLQSSSVFLTSLSSFSHANFILHVFVAVVTIGACVTCLVGAVLTALEVEASGLKNGTLNVDEKRTCLLVLAILLYYCGILFLVVRASAVIGDTPEHTQYSSSTLYRFRYLVSTLMIIISYIPWRVSSRSFIENRVSICVIICLFILYVVLISKFRLCVCAVLCLTCLAPSISVCMYV